MKQGLGFKPTNADTGVVSAVDVVVVFAADFAAVSVKDNDSQCLVTTSNADIPHSYNGALESNETSKWLIAISDELSP